ncbi:MAG: hypothetical protein M3O41_04725 [Pseudomonadota bacterium]|nr:hypothetical protein [Pseudomonadota bacterium]
METAGKLDELIDGAEELLTKLADADNPEIQKLRNRVDHAIDDTRRALAQRGDEASIQLRDIANTIDDYIRDYPWLAVATGVLVAGAFGFIAGSIIGEKKQSPPL